MNPAHESLTLVRDLVALVHENPTLNLAMRASPKFTDLYDRARGIVIVAGCAETAMRPVAAEVAWCGPCRAFHARFPVAVQLGGGAP